MYRNEAAVVVVVVIIGAARPGIIRGLRDAGEYFNMFVYLTSPL